MIPARKVVSTLLAIMRARPNKRGFIVSGIVDLRHTFNISKERVSDLVYELGIMYVSHQCRFDKIRNGPCSAQTVTRIGLLEEIPRSGVQIPCLS